jgi:hypothetical protein
VKHTNGSDSLSICRPVNGMVFSAGPDIGGNGFPEKYNSEVNFLISSSFIVHLPKLAKSESNFRSKDESASFSSSSSSNIGVPP